MNREKSVEEESATFSDLRHTLGRYCAYSERSAHLAVQPHEHDATEHKPAKEAGRDVPRIRRTVTLLLNVRDTPACPVVSNERGNHSRREMRRTANGDLRANVDECENGEEVHLADAEDLLVLVRVNRVRIDGQVVHLRLDLCMHD